jgi:outer membrane protein OmpA-like peptidoglycan-associated protein
MSTEVQDDYLDCGAYQSHINNKSAAHKGFITFTESNGDHFFAWVNGDEIILRSEAYPNAEKMERGIAAILKNCDLPERYSVIEESGQYLLLLWGGGNHQKHTGNREQHSEIGRSCPHPSRAALNALLQFKGSDFANQVVPMAAGYTAPVAAAAAVVPEIAKPVQEPVRAVAAPVSYAAETSSGSSSMGWLKWLLPLLLIAAGIFFWKSCDKKDTVVNDPIVTKDTPTVNTVTPSIPKISVDTATGIINYELGATGDLDLPNGVKLTGIAKDGFENTLVNFIKTGKIDTVNKKANWFTIHDVQFVTNKTEYATAKAMQQIKNIGAILKAYPNVVLKLGGYTDISGDAAKNKDLSDRRAKQVMKDLLANGAAANQIKEAVGYGSEFAEAPLGDKEGMAHDRKTAAKVASM